ncbi:MAG: PaaI family thioesterase [Lachnospiraceae bacterium]|nr:PaaI family thioesterase [Lachnospiraceae bacterium]
MAEKDMMKRMQDMLDESGFIKYLNIELTELEDERAKGRMPFDDRYGNPGGTMHGGCLYSMADTIAGTLAESKGTDVVTVEGSLSFLQAAEDTQYVTCEAELERCGKSLITVSVRIRDDRERLLDSGRFTYFRI